MQKITSTKKTPSVKINNLSVKINGKKILSSINMTWKPGKTYAIIGPNGSGKSTLAHTIAAHPDIKIDTNSTITFGNKNITKQTAQHRAKLGIFVSFQSPPPLPGVTIKQLLRLATKTTHSARELQKKIHDEAEKLNIDKNLLQRPMNVDFSGGEKKKMETLQAMVITPKILILDEIDTGVDVDALKNITKAIKRLQKENNTTVIIITHNHALLKKIIPDEVVVLKDGKIAQKGTVQILTTITQKGYAHIGQQNA
ncbi:MAG: Fe-S cluster assembly ATPase SufC [Candidatus Moranbacteria bacterium]|nr:Fe-S cluster assembly ATPase SufC [Candidatus Moranbacteria bacterium]